MSICPHCSREFEVRAGVLLTPLKARIFDVVNRAGPDGIHTDDLFDIIFEDRSIGRANLKTHIWQINDKLLETDWMIACSGSRAARYWLEKRRH
jgi:hypothetical protein